jgi:hypothetical protein
METWPPTTDLLRGIYTNPERVDAIPWEMPAFLSAYTLHDSALIEVRLEQSDGLLVLIEWDMHWNKRVLPQFRNLVIGIPVAYSLEWKQGSWNQNTLSGANSARISADERRQMLENGDIELGAYQGAKDEISPPLEDEGLTRTTFRSMNWSRLMVLHGKDIHLLCMDDEGRAGELPRVDVTGGG